MHAQIRNTQKTPMKRDGVQLELGLTMVAKWNNQSAIRPLLAWRGKMHSVLQTSRVLFWTSKVFEGIGSINSKHFVKGSSFGFEGDVASFLARL